MAIDSSAAGANIFAPSTTNSGVDNLNGLFKQTYEDKLKDLIPDGVKLLNAIPFDKQNKIGLYFNSPVILGK